MPRLTTNSIVLRRMDFSESSLIVWLFTKELGRISVIAKGAHRPRSSFMGALDIFHLLESQVSYTRNRDIQVLVSARVIDPHTGIGRSPLRLAAASWIMEEAALSLPPGRRDEDLFGLLSSGLGLVEKFPENLLELAIRAWELRFLQILGCGFSLWRCSLCGRPVREKRGFFFFSGKLGGTLCQSHSGETGEVLKVAGRFLVVMDLLRRGSAREFSRIDPKGKDFRLASIIVENGVDRALETARKAPRIFRMLMKK